uniref:DM13 domain-containing protein n=1 Tax=Rhipicephalus pulchellus TaxID=72859 RepID=L7LYM2_RHIPC
MDYGFLTLILVAYIAPQGISAAYYGKSLGSVITKAHGFTGDVYAASENSIVIRNLNYDGNGPAAYFWGGFNPDLDNNGEALPDENGSMNVIKGYQNAEVLLRLPKKITDYKSIGIYCKKFAADFGNVKIPPGYELPREQSLGRLNPRQHNTMASEVILKDSATMQLRQFDYMGNCPGSAYFMAAATPNPQPDQLTRLMYDNGKMDKLERYDKKDVMVMLPTGHHWNEYRWFSVYCMDTKQSYADINIDQSVAEKLPLYDPSSSGHHSASRSVYDPLSVLSTFGMSLAVLLAAIAFQR